MKYKIKADSAFEVCRLDIRDTYCTVQKGTMSVSGTKVDYNKIDVLLLSDSNVLSLHYEGKSFAIQLKDKDKDAVAYLTRQVSLRQQPSGF